MNKTDKNAPNHHRSIHHPGVSWETVKRAREQRARIKYRKLCEVRKAQAKRRQG